MFDHKHPLFSFMGLVAALCVLGASFAQAAEKTWANGLGMKFAPIPAGSFQMGADRNLEDAHDDETLRHRVTISRPFYLGKTEVTQAQWSAVMGGNPSEFKGRSHPVERVSWDDAQEFIRRLNEKEGTDQYRLPTEAEWEYAARAGTTSAYSFGDDASDLGRYAWYKDNSGGTTHPVGQKPPNPWGLHDMYGNVWEWVQDGYDGNYYSKSPSTDPRGPSSGSDRVLRGGSWASNAGASNASNCRSARRLAYPPDYRNINLGFRLVLSPGQ